MPEPTESIAESRTVNGRNVDIIRLVWPNKDTALYDVYIRTDGNAVDLTPFESLNHIPDDNEIALLMRMADFAANPDEKSPAETNSWDVVVRVSYELRYTTTANPEFGRSDVQQREHHRLRGTLMHSGAENQSVRLRATPHEGNTST